MATRRRNAASGPSSGRSGTSSNSYGCTYSAAAGSSPRRRSAEAITRAGDAPVRPPPIGSDRPRRWRRRAGTPRDGRRPAPRGRRGTPGSTAGAWESAASRTGSSPNETRGRPVSRRPSPSAAVIRENAGARYPSGRCVRSMRRDRGLGARRGRRRANSSWRSASKHRAGGRSPWHADLVAARRQLHSTKLRVVLRAAIPSTKNVALTPGARSSSVEQRVRASPRERRAGLPVPVRGVRRRRRTSWCQSSKSTLSRRLSTAAPGADTTTSALSAKRPRTT